MSDNKIIREWLHYSHSDMITACHMFNDVYPKETEIAVFHCQQCAEKALKAYLAAHEIDPPKIHHLPILCKMCADIDANFQSIMDMASDLNPYAVAARYPKQLVSDDAEVKLAIDKAQRIYDFCVAKIDAFMKNNSDQKRENQEDIQ
jgi:HEPN domain-containing protein